MLRRRFLSRIAALIGGGVTLPRAATASVPRPAIELQRSPIAGFQYHHGETLWPRLAVGDALQLVREPDNRYDSRAVRIDWNGQKLGYVPRIDNAAICHLLDSGQPVAAHIAGLAQSDNPWQRVGFVITLPGA